MHSHLKHNKSNLIASGLSSFFLSRLSSQRLTENPVKLGITAETGFKGEFEQRFCVALLFAQAQEAFQALLIAVLRQRNAGLLLKQGADAGIAQAVLRRQRFKACRPGLFAQQAGGRLDSRVNAERLFLASRRLIRFPRRQKREGHACVMTRRLRGGRRLRKNRAQAVMPLTVQPPAKRVCRVRFAQHAVAFAQTHALHKGRAYSHDPHRKIGRPIQQNMMLRGKEKDYRSCLKAVAAVIQQVNRLALQDEIHFQFRVAVKGERHLRAEKMPDCSIPLRGKILRVLNRGKNAIHNKIRAKTNRNAPLILKGLPQPGEIFLQGAKTMATIAPIITAAQRELFEQRGFFVLERVIPPEHLTLLREECQRLMEAMDAKMDAAGTDRMGNSFRQSRYFLSAWHHSERIKEFVFSDLMARICHDLLGPDAYLSFEQYVVKFPEKGMSFSWHQDSGYVPAGHRPYLSCWCALDDVTEENGTVYMLPYDRAGTRDRVEHVWDDTLGDMIGYTGDDPGDPIVAPAGSIALFSSTVFHRSGRNQSPGIRRIFLPQYSAEPVLNAEGTGPMYIAEPFLKDGVRVAPV